MDATAVVEVALWTGPCDSVKPHKSRCKISVQRSTVREALECLKEHIALLSKGPWKLKLVASDKKRGDERPLRTFFVRMQHTDKKAKCAPVSVMGRENPPLYEASAWIYSTILSGDKPPCKPKQASEGLPL